MAEWVNRAIDEPGVTVSPSGLTPQSVADRTFPVVLGGFDAGQVRRYLAALAHELAAASDRQAELRRMLDEAQAGRQLAVLDDGALAAELGQQVATLLADAKRSADAVQVDARNRAITIREAARQHAAELRAQADGVLAQRAEEAEREALEIRRAAAADADAVRRQAEAQAQAEADAARRESDELVDQARQTAAQVLEDLDRRWRVARAEVERLHAGRGQMLDAHASVRQVLDSLTAELRSEPEQLGAEEEGPVPAHDR